MSDIKTWIERCDEHPDHQSGMISEGMIRARMCEEIEDLRAEIERLREALVLGSEVLASHQGSPQREWHSGGAWLYPGDSINVVRAPLPENKVEP
jgi:hypothetical protein